MKTALLHDWLLDHRGGERVLESIGEIFPEADLFTLFCDESKISPQLSARKIHTALGGKSSLLLSRYRQLFPLYPLLLSTIKIPSDVDLVISSSHCVIKGAQIPLKAKHISYVHSPMRYMYDLYDLYFSSSPLLQKVVASSIRSLFQSWDHLSNERIDCLVANSHFVAKRIQQYYGRSCHVIHPFVDLENIFSLRPAEVSRRSHFVMVTAFAPNKRVDLAIKVFNELELPLKIIGSGQQGEMLEKMAGSSISFLGNLSRSEVIKELYHAQALIFPGVEDFGITPLEALSLGTPVIAYKKGGVLETLNESVALWFEGEKEEEREKNLKEALKDFQQNKFDGEVLVKRAMDFSKEKFQENFKELCYDYGVRF